MTDILKFAFQKALASHPRGSKGIADEVLGDFRTGRAEPLEIEKLIN